MRRRVTRNDRFPPPPRTLELSRALDRLERAARDGMVLAAETWRAEVLALYVWAWKNGGGGEGEGV